MTETEIARALAGAVRTAATLPRQPAPARPLSPIAVALSLGAIALAATTFAALVAAACTATLYLHLGRWGFSEFMSEARFDLPLRAKLSAAAVSALYIGAVGATLIAARWRGGPIGWPALIAGGPARRRGRHTAAVAIAALLYAAGFTALQVAGRDAGALRAGPTDVALLLGLATNLVVLAPLAEEVVFRGWLQTALRARWRFWPSYLLTALAFAAIHWDADHRRMLRVLPLAMALGLIREVTGSVRPAILLHATYNLVIVSITLYAAL